MLLAAQLLAEDVQHPIFNRAMPCAIRARGRVRACAAVDLWHSVAMANQLMIAELALKPILAIGNARRGGFGEHDALSLIDHCLSECRVQLHPLGVKLIGVFVDGHKQTRRDLAEQHSNMHLRPICRLGFLQAIGCQRLERLFVHRFELKRMRAGMILDPIAHAVQAQCEMAAKTRIAELPAVRVGIPNRDPDRAQIRDEPRFCQLPGFKEPQHSPVKIGAASPPELIPQCALATVADLAAAQMGPVRIAALRLMGFIDSVYDVHGCSLNEVLSPRRGLG